MTPPDKGGGVPSPSTSELTKDFAAAPQSLRDSAKWMIGGAVATAAGIYAGTSLTNLGTLSLTQDLGRLLAVFLGLGVGFAAIGVILTDAVRLLERDSLNLRRLALAADGEVYEAARAVETAHMPDLPSGIDRLGAFVRHLDELREAERHTGDGDPITEILDRYENTALTFVAVANFRIVKGRWDRLVGHLTRCAVAAILGFTLYAWAANPPPDPAPRPDPPMIAVSIARPAWW